MGEGHPSCAPIAHLSQPHWPPSGVSRVPRLLHLQTFAPAELNVPTTYTHTSIILMIVYICMYTHIYAYAYVCMYMYVYLDLYLNMCVCVYLFIVSSMRAESLFHSLLWFQHLEQ